MQWLIDPLHDWVLNPDTSMQEGNRSLEGTN